MPGISSIVLYGEAALAGELEDLAVFARETFCVPVETAAAPSGDILRDIAACQISDLRRPHQVRGAGPAQVALEEGRAAGLRGAQETLYDGFALQQVLAGYLQSDRADILGVFLTTRLTCTYDESDCRYHARSVICSNPAVISVSGLVEAPARPRQYYIETAACAAAGLDARKVEERYAGTYLDHGDPRLVHAIEGCLLQAVFYYGTGDAFCDDRSCRLYNAHWQADLLHSQITSGRLCDRHAAALADMT